MRVSLARGLELAYEESGSGTPVLFIHGWPHNRTLWSGQLSGLATNARCIAPDLRGFGGSEVRGPYTIGQYADDMVGLLDALHLQRVVVVGLSMGGYVAFDLLRRHRARVRALVLVSTRAGADGDEARARRRRLIEFIERQGVEALAEQQLSTQTAAPTRATRPEAAEALRRMMASASPEGAIGAQRAMIERRDSTDLLRTIDVPTLVVGGAEDAITPPGELSAMAGAIPAARLELIAAAGHVCAFEKPAAFDHLVGELLAGLLHD
ncbi:MAG TPA: alpha/beta fold hydrolase [Gemmatimonadaceae bacterium]|jgi:pimeloyl-ACP methyl ester carboxylesterase